MTTLAKAAVSSIVGRGRRTRLTGGGDGRAPRTIGARSAVHQFGADDREGDAGK